MENDNPINTLIAIGTTRNNNDPMVDMKIMNIKNASCSKPFGGPRSQRKNPMKMGYATFRSFNFI